MGPTGGYLAYKMYLLDAAAVSMHERNIIVVNSGHRDFVFATRNRALQLRYLVRLYVKELVLKNFAGLPNSNA